MTYRDEIVDEVRAIREQLCNKAGSLVNLLATLRAEEEAHTGRLAKNINVSGRAHNSSLYRNSAAARNQKCAEDTVVYRK